MLIPSTNYSCPESYINFITLIEDYPIPIKIIANNYHIDYVKDGKNKCLKVQISGSDIQEVYLNSIKITQLDVTQCPSLKILHCSSNYLQTLDVTQNLQLKSLNCSNNKLKSLILTNSQLVYLRCNFNSIYRLNLCDCMNLVLLDCRHNDLQNLTINEHNNIEILLCDNNKLSKSQLLRLFAHLKEYCHHPSGFISLRPNPGFDPIYRNTLRYIGWLEIII